MEKDALRFLFIIKKLILTVLMKNHPMARIKKKNGVILTLYKEVEVKLGLTVNQLLIMINVEKLTSMN